MHVNNEECGKVIVPGTEYQHNGQRQGSSIKRETASFSASHLSSI